MMSIDPDSNPEYQELGDTLFALNCLSYPNLYTIGITSLTEVRLYSNGGVIMTANITKVLAEVKRLHEEKM